MDDYTAISKNRFPYLPNFSAKPDPKGFFAHRTLSWPNTPLLHPFRLLSLPRFNRHG